MSDQKKPWVRPALYHSKANRRGRPSGTTKATSSATTGERRIIEQQGWDAYRKWLFRDEIQPIQRLSFDASIYSWRGYNNWAKKVRQTWKVDEPVDS